MQRKKMNYLKSDVKPINKRKLHYWLIPKIHDQVHTSQLLKVLNSRHVIICKYSNFIVPCLYAIKPGVPWLEQEDTACNKENMVPLEDNDWLRRNDTYRRQLIDLPVRNEENQQTGIKTTNKSH
jgi:hypothetical protein